MNNLYNVMTNDSKTKLVNFRVSEELKTDFEVAAKLRGAGLSNLIHQYLVKVVREEKERDLKAFENMKQRLSSQQSEPKGKLRKSKATLATGELQDKKEKKDNKKAA